MLKRLVPFMTALLLSVSAAQAAPITIGQWSGAARSWNAGDFSTIKATMTGAGHTVEADEAITAGNLSNNQMFVIGGDPFAALTGAEAAALSGWINGGGVLWFGIDSSADAVAASSLLAAIGSTMSVAAAAGSYQAPLSGGIFASTGPPFDLVGAALTTSLQRGPVAGGNVLAGNMVHWEQIGLGYVFFSSDRFEQNFSNSTAATNNGKFFLNIAEGASGGSVPEPGTLSLLGMGLAAGCAWRRKARRA